MTAFDWRPLLLTLLYIDVVTSRVKFTFLVYMLLSNINTTKYYLGKCNHLCSGAFDPPIYTWYLVPVLCIWRLYMDNYI